jgi:hypothetical protein
VQSIPFAFEPPILPELDKFTHCPILNIRRQHYLPFPPPASLAESFLKGLGYKVLDRDFIISAVKLYSPNKFFG